MWRGSRSARARARSGSSGLRDAQDAVTCEGADPERAVVLERHRARAAEAWGVVVEGAFERESGGVAAHDGERERAGARVELPTGGNARDRALLARDEQLAVGAPADV